MTETFVADGVEYNDGSYDSVTNPKGMANAGHRENLFPALKGIAADARAGVQAQTLTTIQITTAQQTVQLTELAEVNAGLNIMVVVDASNVIYGRVDSRADLSLTFTGIQVTGAGTQSGLKKIYVVPPQPTSQADFSWAGSKTANYTLVDGEVIQADVSGGTFAVKVAALTALGGALVPYTSRGKIFKTLGNALTIDRNGIKLNGQSTNAVIAADVMGTIEVRYISAAYGYAMEFSPTSISA